MVKKWCSPNRSRIILGWSRDLLRIKKHQRDDKISTWRPPENFPKMTEKLAHMKSFWTLFSQISHAGACVAWRRPLGETLMTRRAYPVCLKIKTASIGFIFLNFFSQNGAKHSSYARGYQNFSKKIFYLRFSIWTRGSESFQVVISILMLNFTKLFILAFIFSWIFCTFVLFLLMFVKNIAILWEWQQTKSIFWKFIINLRSHTWA